LNSQGIAGRGDELNQRNPGAFGAIMTGAPESGNVAASLPPAAARVPPVGKTSVVAPFGHHPQHRHSRLIDLHRTGDRLADPVAAIAWSAAADDRQLPPADPRADLHIGDDLLGVGQLSRCRRRRAAAPLQPTMRARGARAARRSPRRCRRPAHSSRGLPGQISARSTAIRPQALFSGSRSFSGCTAAARLPHNRSLIL